MKHDRQHYERRNLGWVMRFVVCVLMAGCGEVSAVAGPSIETPDASAAPVPWVLANAMSDIEHRLARVGVALFPGVEFQGFIANGGRAETRIELPENVCLTLVALTTNGVGDMDAALYTADGEILAADAQPDSHPAIQVCGADKPVHVYYVVHAYEGAGTFLMRAFRGPKLAFVAVAAELGGQPAVAPSPGAKHEVDDFIDGFAQGLQKRGFQPLEAPLRISLEEQQHIRVALPVTSGQCYAVAAFGLGELADVGLRILDDRGAEVVLDEAPMAHAQVQFCAEQEGQYIAEAFAAQGKGDAELLLYEGSARRVLAGTGLWLGKRADQRPRTTGLSDAVAKSVEQARAEGFGAPHEQFDLYLQPGQVVEREISLSGQRCHRLIVSVEQTLVHLQATLSRPSGQSRPLDDEPFCLRQPEKITLRFAATRGYGRLMMSLFER